MVKNFVTLIRIAIGLALEIEDLRHTIVVRDFTHQVDRRAIVPATVVVTSASERRQIVAARRLMQSGRTNGICQQS